MIFSIHGDALTAGLLVQLNSERKLHCLMKDLKMALHGHLEEKWNIEHNYTNKNTMIKYAG